MQVHPEPLRRLPSKKQSTVSPVQLGAHMQLQVLFQQLVHELEKTYEVGFSRAIRANQYVQRRQLQIQFTDRAKSLELDVLQTS